MTRIVHRAAIVMAVVTGSIGLAAAPAAAHSVTGSNWSSNHTICSNCSVNRGNLVAMWQSIVASAVDGLGNCNNFVDGQFGSGTSRATQTWQHDHGLTADGTVGPLTWNKAFQFTVFDHNAAGFSFYRYNGGNFPVWFRKNMSTQVWDFAGGAALFRNTNHPGITSDGCIA